MRCKDEDVHSLNFAIETLFQTSFLLRLKKRLLVQLWLFEESKDLIYEFF